MGFILVPIVLLIGVAIVACVIVFSAMSHDLIVVNDSDQTLSNVILYVSPGVQLVQVDRLPPGGSVQAAYTAHNAIPGVQFDGPKHRHLFRSVVYIDMDEFGDRTVHVLPDLTVDGWAGTKYERLSLPPPDDE